MSKNYETKQVILMRTDLRNTLGQKVRTGKLCAQAAHASGLWLSKRVQKLWNGDWERDSRLDTNPVHTAFTEAEKAWLEGSYAKIVLGVDSIQELMRLVEAAKVQNALHAAAPGEMPLSVEVVTDFGKTEFGDVPTVTCAAIGPGPALYIDRITGHLRPF